MTQPITLISQALLDINAREAGEPVAPDDANEAFATLNQMLDQWSNESMMVYAKQEVIHELSTGQYIYTIGPSGSIGCSFTGSIAGNILTITAITSGAISLGQTINGVLAGTVITSYGTGKGGNTAAALGTYNLTNTQTVVSGALTSSVNRPIVINSAFVRVVNSITGTLDYPVAVINLEKYETIGIKTLPGPWPKAVYYSPTMPVGVLNYWPNPSQGEMHLFCDTILSQFQTVNDTVQLPQGYEAAIRYNLALKLMPSYGKSSQMQIEMIKAFAKEGKALIKKTNMKPAQTAFFDTVLTPGRVNDAGWILSGGF